jgi:hypothetical protein
VSRALPVDVLMPMTARFSSSSCEKAKTRPGSILRVRCSACALDALGQAAAVATPRARSNLLCIWTS